MSKVIEAIYDGRVLVPLQSLDLQAGERVKISVEPSRPAHPARRHRRREVLDRMWQHFEQNPPQGGPLSEEGIDRESIYGRNS